MKMNKLVKSSVATSMALLLLSGTANAEGKITPVSVKKSMTKLLYTKQQPQQILINLKFHRF
ncbi:gamma-hemolysin component C precursor, HlgB [Staphylococcus aureus]|nr:leukocidin-F subunit [Staphylococcus aureus SJOS6053]EVF57650.1 gamma-hemolysin component B [Staphylococcus aureus UCIM6042]QBS08088.1 Leukocidin-F subunit precursor [Staphylococcus aureus]SUJ57083.1 Gamma-hemolysin component B [Staphylococcus aureus]GBX14430.1 gamma-hemolysin component C precursor, HlgB [Staphylococcus aureus]